MEDKLLMYPKNATIYQGLKDIKNFSRWYTDSIYYACVYTDKNTNNSIVRVFNTKDYLLLLNIEKAEPEDFSDTKDIDIKGEKVSLRDLFLASFGKGINKKPFIKNQKDLEELIKNPNNKFKDTQYGKFYHYTNLLAKGRNINYFKKIITVKSRPKIHLKNEFNRLSDSILDNLFLKNLVVKYPQIDGFYSPDLPTDWAIFKCKGIDHRVKSNINEDSDCLFFHHSELGIMKFSKLQKKRNLKYPQKFCPKLMYY